MVKLSTYANRHGAELITTSKDRRRINTNINVAIHELPIYIKWKKTSELDKFFDYLEGKSFVTKALNIYLRPARQHLFILFLKILDVDKASALGGG